MYTTFLFIQTVIAVLLIVVVLVQKSDNDGLSGLSGGGGGNATDKLFSSKSSTNFMTKFTMVLAALFMLNSIVLANLYNKHFHKDALSNKITEMSDDTSNSDINNQDFDALYE